MNRTIMMVVSLLAILSILIMGCTSTQKTAPISGEISSGELAEGEATSELDDLDTLDELDSELDELDWIEAEEAVR